MSILKDMARKIEKGEKIEGSSLDMLKEKRTALKSPVNPAVVGKVSRQTESARTDAKNAGSNPDKDKKILKTVGDSALYSLGKVGTGALDALEDIGDFGLQALQSLGWAGSKLVGANDAAKWFEEEFAKIANKKDYGEYLSEKLDEKMDVPGAVEWFSSGFESAGAMLPAMATAVMTGGGSVVKDGTNVAMSFADDAARLASDVFVKNAPKAAGTIKKGTDIIAKGAKEFFSPSSTIFGMGAAGEGVSSGYKKSGDIGKAMAYGVSTGLAEMATEKIFGGFAGTDIGDSLIDFNIGNKWLRKLANIGTEAVEEGIMTGLDPVFQRGTGVDKNAEWATGKEYAESGAQGIFISLLMNAAGLPFDMRYKSKMVKELNTVSEGVNSIIKSNDDKMKPLTAFSSREDIIKRQNELKDVASKFAELVLEEQEMQSNAQRGGAVGRFGMSGQKAFDANYREGQNEEGYTKGFTQFYRRGHIGQSFEQANNELKGTTFDTDMTADQKLAAYSAGVNDAKASLATEKAAVKYVNIHSKDTGIVENEAAKKVDAESLTQIDRLARALGSRVIFEEDIEGVNGYIDTDGNTHISLNAENPSTVVAAHEMTHRMQQLAPESYRAFRNYAFSVNSSDAEVIRGAYQRQSMEISEEGIMDEVAARYAEKIIRDPENMQKFVDDALNGKIDTSRTVAENRNILQRMLDAIRNLINRIRKSKAEKKAAADKGITLSELEQAERLLKNALRDSAKVVEEKKGTPSVSKADSSLKEGAEVKRSIKMDSKGNPYWLIESNKDIFKGLSSTKELKKAAYNYILKGEKGEIVNEIIDGKPLMFTRISADEYVYGRAGKTLDSEDYKKKMRMAPSIADLIENASVQYETPDHKNHKFAKDGFKNYRGRVRLDNVIFTYIVRVGVNDNQNMFYDINLEVESALPSTNVRQSYKSDSTSTDNISQNDNVVNTQSTQKSGNDVIKNDKTVTKTPENVIKNDKSVKKSIKMDDVLKQNETLKKAYTQLRAELTKLQNGKKVADTKRIATVVKNILDNNGFSYNSARLTEQFEGLTEDAQAIIKGRMDFETFAGKVKDVARAVIDEGTRSDSVAYQESKAVRDYLRTTRISLGEADRNNLGDKYETIRKGTFGRLRLVKEGGTPIDVAYQEMSELFPEYFSTETEVGASAQLRQIVDVLDGLQSLKTDPFGGYADEAAEWLSGMMIDKIFNEVFVLGSTGKVDVSVDMKALRESMGDNLQKIMNRERTWRTREYDKLQKQFEKKTKNYTESRQKAIKIRQIKLHTERLSKALINPSERFAVPEFLKAPVAKFLSCIDVSSDRMGDKTIETLLILKGTYEQIAKQEYEMGAVIDPALQDKLGEIAEEIEKLEIVDKKLTDVSLVTLEKLRTAVMSMEASIRNYNRAFREGKAVQIGALAEAAVSEIKELRKGDKNISTIPGAEKVSGLLNYNMLNPWDYFHQLGGTFEELFMGLREGENKQIIKLALAKNYMEKIREQFEIVVSDVSGKNAKKTTFTLSNGSKVEMTKAQVMSLYLLWRQNASHEHILEGGFRPVKTQPKFVKMKDGKKVLALRDKERHPSVRPTLEDVAAILDTLSDNEKKFAESISEFFTDECAQWGNEVAMQLYGYKKFNTPNYFPIVSDDMYQQEDFGVSTDSTIKNTGFTKKRVKHANSPIVIEDVFDVYARHTSDMAKYNAYVLPLQDIQRVFNSSGFAGENSIKALITSKYGEKAVDYFSKLMIDINAGIKNYYGDVWASKLVSQYKKAKMGANLRVVVQQPMSYIRAAALMDAKYLSAANGHKVDINKVFKYSPIAQWKDWGFFSIDTGKSMYDLMTGKKELSDYTMALAGKADEATWKKIWAAVELETADKHPEMSKTSDEFYKLCGKRFDEVIDRTQVVDSTLHRSQIMRSPDTFTKMSVSFMSEPMKTYNLLRTATMDAVMTGNKKQLVRTLAVTAVSSIALACVTGLYDTLTGDDDEEFWKNFAENLIGDYTGMIPYVKDVASIVQGYDVKRMDMQGISDVVNAFRMLASEKYTPQYKIANMSMKVADIFGVPASSFKKSVYDTVIKNIFKGLNNSWIDYSIAKQMYPVNGKMKGEFLNILFEAYCAGNKNQYDKIFADMMKEGLDAKSTEGGLLTRYKKSGMKETFSVPWNNKSEIPQKETPDKFDLEDLTEKQYPKYESYAVELEADVVANIKKMKSKFTEDEYNEMLSAAYDYVQNVALEKTAPKEYEIETEWILNAIEAKEKYGIAPSEFIRYRQEYGITSARMEKFEEIYGTGIDFDEYLEFAEFFSETKGDKDKNGKTIRNSKQAKVVEHLKVMNLTAEEWDALYFDTAGYKK